MTTPSRVSVVVSTYNRAAGLRTTLEGLRHQTYPDFEVVVVNGPSTDDTGAVLAEYGDRVRAGECPEQSLTRSRNVGISIASGDVVAFIDDDAIPEPTWVADIVSGYEDASIGGVGGIVYDHTGVRLQYRYSVCSRIGEPRWDVEPPLDRYLDPGSDPFLYLQGTNQSFRRRQLAEVGGFNEALVHYFDDCEIAMQFIDAGHRLRALAGAGVHHKYMASSVRNHQRVLIDPYRIVKDRFCFTLLASTRGSAARVTDALMAWADTMRDAGAHQRDAGQLTDAQFDHYARRIDEAVSTALAGASTLERPRRAIPEPDGGAFRPYRTLRAEGRRLTVCFLSKEYPPDDFGGVARMTADFGAEFAARGHEVHVVTQSPDVSRVDFEAGIWVHRIELGGPLITELDELPIGPNLALVRAMYREVCRIHERGPIDLVIGALWLAQGTMCALDPRFATVLLLESGTRTITDFHPSWESSANIQQLIALEGSLFRRARYLHAISDDILRTVRGQYGQTDAHVFTIPLGRHDERDRYRRRRPDDGRVRILFVSRLERRKGVDVLLPVAARLVRRHPHVEVVIAGKDTENTELGESYVTAFRREFGQDRDVVSRVTFTGWLSEKALGQAYADADVFCLPARYESLGLVVIEAMAFGLPVVTSAVGGLVEIVEPDESGFLVPVEDEEALEAALERLVVDASLRRRMGERSRRVFEEKFALARTVPRTIAALEQVVTLHAADGKRALDPDGARAEVARRLPEVIGEVTDIGPARAFAVSSALLETSWHNRHLVQAVLAAWPLGDEDFARALYPLLLGRQADPSGLRHWSGLLHSGYPRLEIVRALATCDEAAGRAESDASWLPALADSLGEAERAAAAAPVRRASARTRAFAAKLRDYLSNAAYLPTNVRELRAEAGGARVGQERLERVLRDQLGRIAGVERRQGSLDDQQKRVEERMRQLEAAVSVGLVPRLDRAVERSETLLERAEAAAAAAREQESRVEGLRRQVATQGQDIANVGQGVADVAASVTTLADWVGLLQKKMEMLALDLREQVATRREEIEMPEPRVVDAERLRRKLDRMGGAIRLNLGCGEKALDEYINVDFREAPHVDIVADARRVPFDEGSVAEIASSHLVEHFRRHHFALVVLPYWKRLLRPGGVLRTICPNWEEMLQRLRRGDMTLEDFTTVTFGAQDYCGDDHFAMYTPATFSTLLARTGFDAIELLAEARQNGLCPEMEIIARKS
jgi:glycosyltransferase involved in cell wall biosynthesis/GT2 family glycosyltransferase